DPGGGGKCGTDVGACVAGALHCNTNTGTLECIGFEDHTGDPEICNGADDDCDMKFDEGITTLGSCGPATNEGRCNIGTLICQGGGAVCTDAVFPAFETCNNVDDDCDMAVDEIFDTLTDPLNCGGCGTVCPTASRTCINS